MKSHATLAPRFAAAALALYLPTAADAAWEYVPNLSVLVESTDNALVDTMNEESASRTALDLAVKLSNFSQRGELIVEPRLTSDYYARSEHRDLETEDKFLDLRGNYAWQKLTTSFRSAYSDVSTLRAEFADALPGDPDVDDPIDVDSGRLTTRSSTRKYLTNAVNVDFELSQRSSLGFELRRTDVSYDRQSLTRNFSSDFDDTSFAFLLTRQTDQRNRISAEVFVSEYSAQLTENETRSVGLAASLNRPLTQTWTLDLSTGVQRTDFRFRHADTGVPVDNADTNYTFGVGLRRRAQRSLWNISMDRALNPNSVGHIVVRDQLRAYVQHQFTTRLTGQFGVRWFSNEALDAARRQNDRTYSRVELEFEYSLTRKVFVSLAIDSLRQKFEGEGTATANSLVLGISYRGLSRRDESR